MKKRNLVVAGLLGLALSVAGAPSPARALPIAAPAVQMVGSNTLVSGVIGNIVIGWEFRPTSDIRVTELGLGDPNPSGFEVSSEVGLWTTGGDLLASAIIPAGTAADIGPGSVTLQFPPDQAFGVFRYVDIADVVLEGGVSYVIGALQTANLRSMDAHLIAFDPVIEFVQSRRSHAVPGLQIPDPSSAFSIGPNFLFVADLPEPGTVALLGMGLFAVIAIGWGRKTIS